MPDSAIAALDLFKASEHEPFFWEAGRPAALLIHGFMGTPAELRPLGEAFGRAGWTSQGILLPGFGRELDSLCERQYGEWIDAAHAALDKLQKHHRPVVLLGYSLGAAVALNVAAQRPPDGLVLLAPFWKIGNSGQRFIWNVFKRLFRRPQPFKRANFEDPRISGFFGGLLPELDLDDPAVRSTVRELRIPTYFVDEIFHIGKEAGKAAAHIERTTLIVQGVDDEAVRPAATRQLLQAFPGPVQYLELHAGHEFIRPDQPGFDELALAAQRFATSLVS